MGQLLESFYTRQYMLTEDRSGDKESGNVFLMQLSKHVKKLKDPELIQRIKDEAEVYLFIGNLGYFNIALSLIDDLDWEEFKDVLKKRRNEIVRHGDHILLREVDKMDRILEKFGYPPPKILP